MIYTVTVNPSLDYIVTVRDFTAGIVNRTAKELIYPGGKGINVSIVLQNLGVPNTALGFTAGFTGDEIARLLKEKGVKTDFIRLENGTSRINVKLRSGQETEINGQGPAICSEDIRKLYRKLDALQAGDVLVLAGSIPDVMPESLYMDIMDHLKGKQIRIVVDATRELLVNVLPYGPFLIKPNIHELGEIFGEELTEPEEIIAHAKRLQQMGAQNVLVSMAGDGAVLLTEDGRIFCASAPEGRVVNSVGAGDSMVAGFLSGYLSTGDYREAFMRGVCAGSASAFSEELAEKEEVEALLARNRHLFDGQDERNNAGNRGEETL